MVLFRVKLQKLLHSDVGKAKRIGSVLLLDSGINLKERELNNYSGQSRKERHLYTEVVLVETKGPWQKMIHINTEETMSTAKQTGQQTSPLKILAPHPDPFNHEADVSDAHEVCGLVN